MLFNSYEFIFLFLPISFFIYFYLNKKRLTLLSKVFLLLSSLFFYSWWNIIYLPLILSSILFNFLIGSSLCKKNRFKQLVRKQLLAIGIIGNIALLGYFKYSDFFIENFNFVFNLNKELLNLALPLAISFFTFQQIAYLVDSFRYEIKEYSLLNYGIFVSFFPQLIAGPIVHHKEVMPQFSNIRNKVINYQNIVLGIFIFSIGLFKKVIIADTFAKWANIGFDTSITLTFFEAWATAYAYAFQLYFDFSAYSDMAIGLALLFNIKLPINFNSPYKATSITQFWNRWHITLSSFINKYIFKPILNLLGTYSFSKALLAIFLSMLISGLWHGASWLFIIFGFINAIALVINQIWKKKFKIKIHKYIGWVLTFNTFVISIIFFRANEWADAIKVIKGMFGFNGIILPSFLSSSFYFLKDYNITFGYLFENINADKYIILWLLSAFIVVLFFNNSMQLRDNFKLNYKTLIISVILFSCSILSLNKFSEFIYFNF
ncbi:membrane-bound O-acyltransferase family protein [Malaciobacter mytili LMG 24559]|uniref:Membrane-bound O-acyltransferase family protein n=1 Tax=Malaciobacter mytili LMG 24559 TaxID=1032238 RepID=A0AAX2AK60_9BACT|nr:MBOAT family O-acyltransferase [Malaciobacter mytili]AXH15812.1 membrane-bound O-acyl transferase, MBOAT family [Malaciobacter mytili LMG 24559]RXK16378.1 membrane-bound O-acyltransferase family protein [Malaciobacter mytili LMG 24559]